MYKTINRLRYTPRLACVAVHVHPIPEQAFLLELLAMEIMTNLSYLEIDCMETVRTNHKMSGQILPQGA